MLSSYLLSYIRLARVRNLNTENPHYLFKILEPISQVFEKKQIEFILYTYLQNLLILKTNF